MNDDELRAALARRASGQLSADDSNDILRAARSSAVAPPRRSFVPRVFGWVAAAAAVLVLVIVALPILLSPPRPGATSSSAATAESTPSPTSPAPTVETPQPSETAGVLPIASAQALSDLIGDPQWVGRTVLAEVQIDAARPVGCTTGIPCPLGLLHGVSGQNTVTIGWRDATADDGVQYDDGNGYRWVKQLELPTGSGLFAFTVGQDAVEYLGPAYLTPAGEPVTVADLQGVSNTLPSDGVIAVGGWLAKNWPPPPCAAPPEMLESPPPALDYYCYGTWIIPSEKASLDSGVRAQNDAYEMFAPSPFQDEHGVRPEQGIYLVRNAGCPIQAPCPAWRMVGRLDEARRTVAPPSAPPRPAPPATPVSTRRHAVVGADP